MFLVAELRFCAADLADRVLDLARLKVLAAPLVALVAPGRLAAVGAGALNIPVGQEPLAFRAVSLVDRLLVDVALLLELGNNRLCPVVVGRIVSHPEPVEHHAHAFERVIEVLVIFLRERPGGCTGFFGRDHDRGPVVIRTADEDNVLACPPHVADIRISRDVCSQMAKMAGAVGIRQPARDEQRWRIHHYVLDAYA